jgi:RNA polymerase sigma-70 factor (ECF subfamily)
MTDAGWAILQRHLLTRYADIKKRLTRYLGSADLANDALHDTWLRLQRGGELATVRNPDTYLYSMAINIAFNRRRADNRYLTASEVEALLDLADDAPNAARVLEARVELEALVTIIGELPVRQQAILLAARLEGVPRREIAARFGVSERFVQRELQEAHDYCATRLEKMMSGRFRSGPGNVSFGREPLGPVGKTPKRSGIDEA